MAMMFIFLSVSLIEYFFISKLLCIFTFSMDGTCIVVLVSVIKYLNGATLQPSLVIEVCYVWWEKRKEKNQLALQN